MVLFDRNISTNMQRWFGLSLGIVLAVLAIPLRELIPLPVGLISACSVTLVYYARTDWQVGIIRAWQTLTYPLAFVVGHALLLLVYCGVLAPLAILLRVLGKDVLELGEHSAESFWTERSKQEDPKDKSRYFRQY